ncbi:hypothetical protein GCM10010518_04430 [Kitasatospora cinereorecta]
MFLAAPDLVGHLDEVLRIRVYGRDGASGPGRVRQDVLGLPADRRPERRITEECSWHRLPRSLRTIGIDVPGSRRPHARGHHRIGGLADLGLGHPAAEAVQLFHLGGGVSAGPPGAAVAGEWGRRSRSR